MAKKITKSDIDAQFQNMGEEEAIALLRKEGKRLERIARGIWSEYIETFEPKQYVRTYDSEKAIRLGRVKKISEDEFGIELTFDDDYAYHPSIIKNKSKTHKEGHSFMLISEGWNASKLEERIGRSVYKLTYFEGINYIGRVKEAFNSKAPNGILLVVNWKGKQFKKGRRPYTR